MAIFGKKQSDAEATERGSTSKSAKTIEADPDKAEPFFRHARTNHETSNYEYAMTLWLQGLGKDPTSMTGYEAFYESCQAFIAKRQKFGCTKDQEKSLGGKSANPQIERMQVSLLHWGAKPLDVALGAKAIEAMLKISGLDLGEPVYWLGAKVLDAARANRKTKKDLLIKLKDFFVQGGIYTLAVKAGERAIELDPTDSPLQAEVRNLSAQATMTSGGYEQTGQEGGFRANIRDNTKQRQLEEEERIVKTEDVVERALANAKADYESRPSDTAAIQKYARVLLDRGTPADEKVAFDLLSKAFELTHEFRFRQQAGEIRIRQGRRKISQLRRQAEANPDDAAAQELHSKGLRAILKLEAEEYEARVRAYPTELGLKFELGKRLFELGKLQESIELFQIARDDPKRRAECLSYLGRAFLQLGWENEAIEMLRAAIEAHPLPGDETGRELRYRLMVALEAKARSERDVLAADEASRIASSIAVEQINFRDIRERRTVLQELVRELRAPSA